MINQHRLAALAVLFLSLAGLGYAQQPAPQQQLNPNTPVYFSRHGKTYHLRQDCFALSRSTEVYTATLGQAEAHGLHRCHICFRTRKPKQDSSPDWAKPAPETKGK